MKLHVLGCGDAFGSGGRNQSSYLLDAGDRLVLLDCGPTALLAMKRAGFDSGNLDAVILSHLHGDHFGGLPFFIIEYLYRRQREQPLIVAGPMGTEERVRQLYALMYGSAKGAADVLPLDFVTLQPERSQDICGIEVYCFRVPHQVQDVSLALKLTYQTRRVLFSGDSAWTDRFIEQAADVDLFLCECSFYDEQPGMHVNYRQLAANLARLKCKKLLLTHLGEDVLERRHQLAPGIAEDGMVIEF